MALHKRLGFHPATNLKLLVRVLSGGGPENVSLLPYLTDTEIVTTVYPMISKKVTVAAVDIYTAVIREFEYVVEKEGYVVVGWSTSGSRERGDYYADLTIDSEEKYPPYTPGPTPTLFTLVISATDGGTTNPAPGTYHLSVDVTVEAIADLGYGFDHWVLDGLEREENPITITMDKNHDLHGVFEVRLIGSVRQLVKDIRERFG